MAAVERDARSAIPWWREPTREQWYAWVAAWLGWTLDAFDFTVFLLIMVPISQEFGVPLSEVAFVLTLTLWMRLIGAVASGWLAHCSGSLWAPSGRQGQPWQWRAGRSARAAL